MGHLTLGAIHNRVEVCRRLAADPHIDLTAIYESTAGVEPRDFGYGRPVVWDSDLLDGYKSVFLRRATNDRRFTAIGILDPDIVPLLIRERFEVLWIHSYVYATHALAGVTQRLLGGKILLRDTQTLIDEPPGRATDLRRGVKRAGIRVAYGRAHGLHVGTHSRRWFETYGFPSQRLHFTPNEIDAEAIADQAERLRVRKAEIRTNFGIGRSAGPVILWVGRFAEMKQLHFLLDAYKRVRQDASAALLMVGSGPLERLVRSRVERDRIPDVHFAGFLNRTEIAQAYAAADLFTLPSLFGETFGLVVNEAMACGLPVVVTDAVGCAPDLVHEGVNGYVVGRNDLIGLADRLHRVVADQDLRGRLGAASRELISGWTVDATVAGTVSAIAAAVGDERWEAASAPPARQGEPD